MWAEILMMFSELPGEHTKQEAEYRAKMQCLREKRCYTILDTRDNTWIIREKDQNEKLLLEKNKCSSTQTNSSNCDEQKNETKGNEE